MKQYTTPEQTAKLIELGFEEPKSKVCEKGIPEFLGGYKPITSRYIRKAYSIEELKDKLPATIDGGCKLEIEYRSNIEEWLVCYGDEFCIHNYDLVDALFDSLVFLKAEEVI